MIPKAPGSVLLLALDTLAHALPQQNGGVPVRAPQPCRLLAEAGLGDQLFYAGDEGYTATIQSYYGGDSWDLSPYCILKPETTDAVSVALKSLNSDKAGKCWNVAIRGGGHSNFPASNTDSGVTIDLVNLDTLKLNNGSISVGSGNRWGSVYKFLEPQGLMVAGGRENTVGVGGLLLGGGFSWYSGNVGFAADNVVAYEVVLANGSVIKATSSEHPDLFKALKGGAGNFGLVTNFELKTFPAGNLYGGVMVFPYEQSLAVLQKFVDMIDGHPDDTGFASITWSPSGGKRVAYILANMAGDPNAAAFDGLEDLSPVVDMRASQPVTGIAAQIASVKGEYQVWNTLTYHNTMDMGRKIVSSFDAVVEDVKGLVGADEDLRIIYLMTPFPTLYSSYGDNVFGLGKTHTKNSVVFSLQAVLPTSRYRDMLREKLGRVIADIEAYAKETGQDVPFRYLNYAGPDQSPLETFGEENVQFMKNVAAKYDPGTFFQHGVPGGFKLADI